MTWLRKMLAVRVMLMTVAWMCFTASVGFAQTEPTEGTNDEALPKRFADAARVRAQNAKKIADLDAIVKASDIEVIKLADSLLATLDDLVRVWEQRNQFEGKAIQRLRENVKELRDTASRR